MPPRALAPTVAMNAIVPTIASIVIGAGFGWVSEFVAGKLVKAPAVKAQTA